MTRISPSILALVAALAAPLGAPLGAQQPSPSDTLVLSLEEAVALAQRASDETRLATAELEVAEAQILAARANGLPQLRLATTYSHQIENARAQAVGQIFGQANTYNSNLSLSQTLFQGGRVVNAARAANRVGDAARLDVDEARRSIAVDVQRAYLGAVLAAELVVIQERNLAFAEQQLAQVERLEQAGRAARYDVLRARVQRSNLEPLVIQARNDRVLAELELKRLLNLPVERPLALTTTLDAEAVYAAAEGVGAAAPATPGVTPAVTPGASVAAVERGLVEERGAVRAARLTAEARRFGIRVARADRLPTVSVTATSGYLAFPTGSFLQNLPTQGGRIEQSPCPTPEQPARVCSAQNGGWFSDRGVNIAINWPLFDGLRTRGNIELAEAQARIAELQLEQRREAVTLEIARARADLAAARASFAAQRQNAAEAEEAYRLAVLRFERGVATQLETSDAQLAQLTAQTNAARAAFDLYVAMAEVARAEGRPIPMPPARAAAAPPSPSPSTVRTP